VRPLLISFVLGAFAGGFVLLVAALALGVAADAAGWGSFRVGVGPLVLVEFERRAVVTGTTLGNGVVAVACACGLLNAGGAAVLRRRMG
jgi:hypothetical protein